MKKDWLKIAKVSSVTREAIEIFSEENVIDYFNTFNKTVPNNILEVEISNNKCIFNPLES